jgi:predicted alpha-1,2-mannosidase
MIKRILKYVAVIVSVFLISGILILLYWSLRYQNTVNEVPKKISTTVQPGEFGQWVNPFIGTGGFPTYVAGDDIPGATLPFGMVRLSPDTHTFCELLTDNSQETVSTAGYYYGDNEIMGFSHTRMVGTGAYDGGHFRVFPAMDEKGWSNYQKHKYLRFSHADELASPGYYAVRFKKPDVLAELTATERVGIHRYTFSGKEIPHLLIDVASALGRRNSSEGEVDISPEKQEITGCIRTFASFSGRYGGEKIYFAAHCSRPFQSVAVWSGNQYLKGQLAAKGDKPGVDLGFRKEDKVVELRLGISYVSIENARQNLEIETSNLTFAQIQEKAKEKWEEKLGLIKIDGGTSDQRTIFYSALYRSLQMPTLFNDANGDYMGFDKQVHKTEGFNYYTDLSLWDTFRTIHPLFTMIVPEEQRNMMVSLVKMCEQGGVIPRWPSGYGYTGSMIGSSGDIVISEAYQKGIRGFDVEKAYQAMRKAALAIDPPKEGFKPRGGMDECLKYGYCPADKMERSVSKTLEYAYADDAISKLAIALGYTDDAKLFAQHAQFYRNIWNSGTQYFQGRFSDGKFDQNFKPLKLTYLDFSEKYTKAYVEGCALQWRWALFFDPEGLISLFKSHDYFVSELNAFFEKADSARGTLTPGSYYWHGNEPDIHAAYLFNVAGRPDLTQKWVRWILDNKYGAGYDGVDGDDDAGTLSAWYVWSALGMYPLAGSDIYQLGAPLFPKAEIKMGDKILTIDTENYAPQNKYVKQIWLNDVPLDRYWIKHSEIVNGGTLRFEMTNKPKL